MGRPRLRRRKLDERSASARSSRGSANPAAPASRSPPAHPPAKSGAANNARTKTRDPQARHRWPVERTNAWLKARRRIATRRDRKPDNYLAFLQLGMILILTRSF